MPIKENSSKKRCVAGVDMGSATSKAVILDDMKQILSFAIRSTGQTGGFEAGTKVLAEALRAAGLLQENIKYIVTTGYGRNTPPYPHEAIPEILCHAAGAHELCPQAGTIIDIGGQDSKVISVSKQGDVTNFIMNDKCAAGTGRFLELLGKILHLRVDELGPVSLKSRRPCEINNTCAVFAETEVVTLRAEGAPVEDLISGVHKAMANRIVIMGSGIGFRNQVVFSGGVANNIGVKKALEEKTNLDIWVPQKPQIIGALGAALIAHSRS